MATATRSSPNWRRSGTSTPSRRCSRQTPPHGFEEGGTADGARRELTAATVALEIARLNEWRDWKRVQHQPLMTLTGSTSGVGAKKGAETYQPPDVLYWSPSPRLIAWANRLFTHDLTPRPIERWWQLAAVAVAERSEDFEFLSGNRKGYAIANPKDEITYLAYVHARFPNELRFVLAQGISIEWQWPEDAKEVFKAIENDETVGGEATMRMGAIAARHGDRGGALDLFNRTEQLTRDPYVVFLARFLRGRTLEEQTKVADAETAYRRALATVPRAQSASVALSSLLFLTDRRLEADRVVDDMLNADPTPPDPWREYAHGDDRFWPRLVRILRTEIRK